jgi:hypothetical protein
MHVQNDRNTKQQDLLTPGTEQSDSGNAQRSRQQRPATEKPTAGAAGHARAKGTAAPQYQLRPEVLQEQLYYAQLYLDAVRRQPVQPAEDVHFVQRHLDALRRQTGSTSVVQQPPIIQQPLPAQESPALWERLLRGIVFGIMIVVAVHDVTFGGVKGCALAILFLLPQTFFVVLLFVFPDTFPATQPWEQQVRTGLLLLTYTLVAWWHCDAAKDIVKNETNDPESLFILCYHGFFLLAAFLLSKAFIS